MTIVSRRVVNPQARDRSEKGCVTHHLVPTRLTSSSDRLIHHIIRHKEISLQLPIPPRTRPSPPTQYPYPKPISLLLFVVAPSMRDSVGKNVTLTNSIHQPNRPALKYSSSVNSLSRRILTVSTTERPRLSFPPGVLWLRTWGRETSGVGEDEKEMMRYDQPCVPPFQLRRST